MRPSEMSGCESIHTYKLLQVLNFGLAVVACATVGLVVGWYFGRKSNPPYIVTLPPEPKPEDVPAPSVPSTEAALASAGEESEDEEATADGDLASISAGLFEECKMVSFCFLIALPVDNFMTS